MYAMRCAAGAAAGDDLPHLLRRYAASLMSWLDGGIVIATTLAVAFLLWRMDRRGW